MTGWKVRQEQPQQAAIFHIHEVLRHLVRSCRRMPALLFARRHPAFRWMRRVLRMHWEAGVKFFEIEGEQHAAAFAYYAFFALFPLILLFVTLGSQVWDHATVVNYIIGNLGQYLPFNTADRHLVDDAIHGIVDARGSVSTLAMLGLVWSASRFFHSMVRGVNRAWETIEYPWWQLPLHSLMMLMMVASALFIGMLVPLAVGWLRRMTLLHLETFNSHFELIILCVPSLVLFYGISMFFKFSPRRRTRFSEVAFSAFLTTLLLQGCRYLFERYVYHLSNFNSVYGAFAVVIVLLVWIYLSGVIIMYGGCLCAAQARVFGRSARIPVRHRRHVIDYWPRRHR
ncbi:YihY/virulence factor BrkB family protein [Prosthecobacter sp.]|uniref:YihY/virulence factor BrkB family protein n=1 Tax=Prosthecobacter sp. TaxID=1965333 RepID=UPI0037836D4F